MRELPQACSPLTGGEFSAEPQQGDSPSADGGNVPRPAAGAKRKDNLRFSFLFELLPFPCFLIRRRFPICDRCENRERQSGYRSVSFSAFSQGQIHYCYTYRRVSAGAAQGELPEGQEKVPWGITVPRNSLARFDRQHWRI